jgi:putative copper resistance protein D
MPDIWGFATIVTKMALYMGLFGATGLVMVRVCYPALLAPLDAMLRTWALRFAGLALLAVVLRFMLRGAVLTGEISGMVDPEMLGLLWSTPVGDAVTYRLLGIGLIGVGLFLPAIGQWMSLLGGTLALWSFTQIGHVGEVESLWVRPLLLAHLLGVAFWVGVLAPLRHCARQPDHFERGANLGHSFGQAASVIVPLLVLAGLGMAWLILGDLTALVTTAYGLTLVAKVALVALLLGLAAANKLRFVPAMRAGDRRAAHHLVRSVEIETLILLLIFAATATLTSVLTLPY